MSISDIYLFQMTNLLIDSDPSIFYSSNSQPEGQLSLPSRPLPSKINKIYRPIQKFHQICGSHKNQSSLSNKSSESKKSQQNYFSRLKVKRCSTLNKASRKKRVHINQEVLSKINLKFQQYQAINANSASKKINLKDIAKQVNLGYSTIFQKHRQYKLAKHRLQGELKLAQRPKYYKKSQQMINLIEASLQVKKFKSSVQISEFIQRQYGKTFKRARIANYLRSRNKKQSKTYQKPQKNKHKKLNIQDFIINSFLGFSQNDVQILYFSLRIYNLSKDQVIVVMVLRGNEGMSYKCVQDLAISPFLGDLINLFEYQYGLKQNWVIVANAQEIFMSKFYNVRLPEKQIAFSEVIVSKNGKLFYLPPSHQYLNSATECVHVQQISRKITIEIIKEQMEIYKSLTTVSSLIEPKSISEQQDNAIVCQE